MLWGRVILPGEPYCGVGLSYLVNRAVGYVILSGEPCCGVGLSYLVNRAVG